MRSIIIAVCLFCTTFIFAQKDNSSINADYKVTKSVEKQREMGYPINVLESLPVIKGCEALTENHAYLAKCMKDQFNFMFASVLNGIEQETKDPRGVEIYIEFVINQDGTISAPERVKVSEQNLDQFVRTRFKRFRHKVNKEKLILSPGKVHDKNVNTLYGVRFIKAFKK